MNTLSSESSQQIACGIDLGGTKIVVALVEASGDLRHRGEIRGHRGWQEDVIVGRIANEVSKVVAGSSLPGGLSGLSGIGVGTSGHVDYENGTLISNSNLPGFRNYPIAARLGEHLGAAVVVDNDANAQAYGEYLFGAGRGFTNVMFVTVSTGLGAGIIINGEVYRGAQGTAGEIGHTIVNPEGTIQCGCGNYGCLMAHASGLTLPVFVRQLQESKEFRTKIDLDSLGDDEINGELIKSGVETQDELCMHVVSEYARYLGIGLYNAVQTLNPGVIVLGGGLIGWGGYYLDRVRDTLAHLCIATIGEPPEVRVSELKADAAVIGAAALGAASWHSMEGRS